MSLFHKLTKQSSFSDVKAIYDSLPEEQKLLVSPRGRFVDSPNLQLRVLNDDKTGFAEAYKLKGGPKDSAFVTLAVSPEAQGKGVATELMKKLIAQAREKKIKKLIYRLASENDASRGVVQKFVDKPRHKFKDAEEYEINTSPLYHLSQDLNLNTLNPRVPKNFFTEHGYEDAKTPRVSLAPTVEGALAALSQGGLEGKTFNIYEVLPETIQQHVPSVEEVPDAKVTGEYWALTPAKLKLLRQIQLIKATRPKKFKYGDNEATAYGWSYNDVSDEEKPQEKKSSAEQDIYDSLSEEQKRFVNPDNVAEEDLDPRLILARYVTPEKDGYARVWRKDLGSSADIGEVEIAVKPSSQGRGLSKKILKKLIQEARAKKIKELIYTPNNSNEASQRLATFFAGQPTRVMKGSSEWRIKIPQGKKDKIFDAVVKAYKDKHGFDLSHMVMEPTDKARFSDSTINENIPVDEVGGSWARNNTIYVGNNLDKVVKKYGLDMSPEEFKKHIIAHELAHEIDNNLASDKFRKKILEQAAKEKFTTPYLEGYKDDDPKKKEEIFAEYLAKSL